MLIDVNNSNSNDRGYLCQDCKFGKPFKVKSRNVEVWYKCSKWCTNVQNVGVCKYYRKDLNLYEDNK